MDGPFERFEGDDICYKIECGNGIINTGERCDDNNTVPGDGCSSSCRFEPVGFNCINLNYSIPSHCTKCSPGCFSCIGPKIDDCLECQVDYEFFDDNSCILIECGNGKLNSNEICDDKY